jgi:hypothetical protein
MRLAHCILASALLAAPMSVAAAGEGPEEETGEEPGAGTRVARAIATYVPNRLLDLLDVARLRLRFGPGAASSFRVTQELSATAGTYSVLALGLPGPRGEPRGWFPLGFEEYPEDAAPVSPFRAGREPYYGKGEIGGGIHLGFIGIDLGADPIEVFDLALGLLFIDLLDDDF